MSEWESFQRDFTLCDCLACLKTCCETARKSPDLEGATWKLQEASYHALESLKSFNLPGGWAVFAETGLVQSVEAIETIEDAEALVKAFEEAMPSLQPKILRRNWWLLKPVDGAVGKGRFGWWFRIAKLPRGSKIQSTGSDDQECIGLLGGLGSNMPQIAPEMFKGHRGRASDGYILQKYVEMPHLLDPSLLQEAEQAELAWQPTTSSAAAPRVVWFYEHGYIELCTTPFTESLEAQFYPDEQLLCGPNYGMSGDTWDPIGAF
ncbi:unnamed protein product, partial [Durusdinium trenchii]